MKFVGPDFNLLSPKRQTGSYPSDWISFTTTVNDGLSWISVTVRKGAWSHYERRKVKGFDPAVSN